MKVVHTFKELKQNIGSCLALTIGKFDGIHLGHLEILSKLQNESKAYKCPSAIITFASHPQKDMIVNSGLKCLIDIQGKRNYFQNEGVDFIVELDFENEISQMTPLQFLDGLSEGLEHLSIVLGDDFKFGKGRSGSLETIEEYFKTHKGELKVVKQIYKATKRVSSTLIRDLIFSGNIKEANSYLGRPYCINGHKCSGHQIGRELGTPTINLQGITTLIPKPGVYASNTRVGGIQYRSITYIGTRGTFQGEDLVFESNLFEFNSFVADGERIEVEFLAFIRGDKIFASRDELVEQIAKDKQTALAV